jgi:hypothetical protein
MSESQDGSDICLTDDVLRRGRADHCREPPERGRAPMGPTGIADSVSESERFASTRGVLQMAVGLFTGPSAVSYGGIVHVGDINHRAITRARQPGQLHGVPTVGCDVVTGLLGHVGGGHHPAVVALFRAIPVEPGATGASLIDTDQVWGLRWHRWDAVIEVTLTCADDPKVDDLGAVLLSDRGHSHRVFGHIQAGVKRARLAHG